MTEHVDEKPNLSLKDDCISCGSKCCSNDLFIITKAEHDQIIDAGFEQQFFEVEIEEGTFFVNDYAQKTCKYLDENKQCIIEGVKPKICRSYPVTPSHFNNGTKISTGCPVWNKLPPHFIQAAEELALSIKEDLVDRDTYFKVIDRYDQLRCGY